MPGKTPLLAGPPSPVLVLSPGRVGGGLPGIEAAHGLQTTCST
ncbi:hypothetical protein ACFFWC_18935 [Plantactinospora siamensis]|uniref:Uncharacterized protein n=1 Tax=Plantactinospora siamensis TaxID=555372 RepID=A0ABV6P494_9ACTN